MFSLAFKSKISYNSLQTWFKGYNLLHSVHSRGLKTYYPKITNRFYDRRTVAAISHDSDLGNVWSRPKNLRLRHPPKSGKTVRQPPYRSDFMNFKVMSGNEILLNLENSEFLRNGELVNALHELSKRRNQDQHDWEVHPYTKLAFDQVKKRLPGFTPKHLSQLCMIMDNLNYNNMDFWEGVSKQILFKLHTFDGRQLTGFLDVFVPEVEDEMEDDIVYMQKEIEKKLKKERANQTLLESIIQIFPAHVKDLTINQLVRVCEVCVQRNLGDERLFKEFLFFYVEKKIKKFSIDQYLKILRVLGEKQYTDDVIFWNNFIFPRIYIEPFNQTDAQRIWDALIALKVKCPDLNCTVPINYIESVMKTFEIVDGFQEKSQEEKDEIKNYGELPDGIRKSIQTHTSLTGMYFAFSQSQNLII